MLPNQNPPPPPPPNDHHHHHHQPPLDLNSIPPSQEFDFSGHDTREFLDRKGKGKLVQVDDDDDDDDESSDEEMEEQEEEEPLVERDFLSCFLVDTHQPFVNNAAAAAAAQQQQQPPQPPPPYKIDFDAQALANFRYHQEFRERYKIVRRQRYKETAKNNALRFARFNLQDAGAGGGDGGVGGGSSSSVPEPQCETEDSSSSSPTRFSMAMEAIQGRLQNKITWVSRKNPQDVRVSVPSLFNLSLKALADNADAIVSLEGVPDELRHMITQLLCDSRTINSRFLELLVSKSPTEIRIVNCSWLSEEEFTACFQSWDPAHLEVLQLDLCGRCLSDYALPATLAKSPGCLPRVTSLSLSGACRLTDRGLRLLVSSAPVLRSINLSQCSLLTPASLNLLANSLGSLLKELYLDDFHLTDAVRILPALKKLKHLEVLSLAGIEAVSDQFIKDYIIAQGHNIKELVLKGCINLTDASVKVIAEQCPGLQALDLMNLSKLTDSSIGYLTNNCQELRTLKLCRNPFSDEAIASFLEIIGRSLEELSLNGIRKVGQHTALSLARHARNLHTLDLSWCRNLSDNDLGLIVDNCFSLKFLKLFGCTQVTSIFLDGYSNSNIQIIGLKLTPLLQHIEMFKHPQGALRYSSVSFNDEE